MIKAITLQDAMRTVAGETLTSHVDVFVQHVNSELSTKAGMLAHRCSPAVGHFYDVSMRLDASPEECEQIETRFKEAGWKDVKVVYWRGKVAVELDAAEHRGWHSYYDGEPLQSLLLPKKLRKAQDKLAAVST